MARTSSGEDCCLLLFVSQNSVICDLVEDYAASFLNVTEKELQDGQDFFW
jgi:hypothetical protein